MGFPSRAKVVIVGAGIVGNSIAYHLANLGWKDIVLIDKGPMPNPGGSTGHASNFIYLVDHNKEMDRAHRRERAPVPRVDVYTACGGLEVARSETRMNELRRRMDSAKNWGIDRRAPGHPGGDQRSWSRSSTSRSSWAGSTSPEVGVCDSSSSAPCAGRRPRRWVPSRCSRDTRRSPASTPPAAGSAASRRRAAPSRPST